MKKLISTIIFAILLFSCLSLTVFADTPATISDDYQTLFFDGKSYSRADTSMLKMDSYITIDDPIELSPAQEEIIQEIELETNEAQNIIYAHITFHDNAALSLNFLQDDYLEEYNKIVSSQSSEYVIDFQWPEGNTVKARKTGLFGTPVTLTASDLEWCDYYFVTVQSEDGALAATTGAMLIIEDTYYYVDFAEASVENGYAFYPSDYSKLLAHIITSADLKADIMEAEDKYYGDNLGFLYDDNLSRSISTVFIILGFVIVPLITFTLFLILAIRSKSVYKKLFRTIYILSIAELAVFAIVFAFLLIS